MAEMDTLQAVIEENRQKQKEARNLNIRAGETVFKVMSRAEWRDWLTDRLEGARKADEIINFEALRLPDLNPELVEKILAENPDTVEVLGRQLLVHYSTGSLPQIVLEGDLVEENRWMELSDEGVKLPGGRSVSVKIVVDPHYYGGRFSNSDILKLKEEVKNYLNRKIWDSWEKPRIPIPDFSADDTVPEIEVREYGQCAVTGEPLLVYGTIVSQRIWSDEPIRWSYEWYRERNQAEEKREKAMQALAEHQSEGRKKRALKAIEVPDPSREDASIPEIAEIEGGYGVVAVNPSRWSRSDSRFKVYWTENREEAEALRVKAVAKLDEVKAEEIEKRQIAEAKAEAEEAKSKARNLRGHADFDKLPSDLGDKLYNYCYSYIPSSDLEEIRQWATDALAVCQDAEEILAAIERKRAERREMGIEIPDMLIRAYKGDEDKAYEFMQKVADLRTRELDEHVVRNCGRDRVRFHLVQASGDDNFFLGADPNDVKYYVEDVHYNGADYGVPVKKVEISESVSPPTADSLAALAAKFGK